MKAQRVASHVRCHIAVISPPLYSIPTIASPRIPVRRHYPPISAEFSFFFLSPRPPRFVFFFNVHSPAADASTEELDKLVGLHVEKLVEVRSAVRELAEGALLGRLGDEIISFSLL